MKISRLLSLFVLRLQGGAPSYGAKFCKTERRPGSQIMVGAVVSGLSQFQPNLDNNFDFFFLFISLYHYGRLGQ